MIWIPVNGWPMYSVSDTGLIKSKTLNKMLSPSLTRKGYHRVALFDDGFRKGLFVHRIVALSFIKNPNNHKVVNHLDGDKLNNHVSNLEWCTPGQNQKHAYDIGLRVQDRGSKHGRSLFTEQQVTEIRRLYSAGVVMVNLAKQFNTATSNIGYIVNRITWTHI